MSFYSPDFVVTTPTCVPTVDGSCFGLQLLSLCFALCDEAGNGSDGVDGDGECDSDGEGVVTVDRQMGGAPLGISTSPLPLPVTWFVHKNKWMEYYESCNGYCYCS